MDAALLTSQDFWDDRATALAGEPALAGHVLFETSGSSGRPQQVALSKNALLVSAEAVNGHLEVSGESCWGLALPLHHVGGFGVAARAFQAGCGFQQFDRRWNAQAFAEWLESKQVTHTSLVPTQVHDLVKAGRVAPDSLVAIVVGGGHLEVATGQQARDLGWPVLASYGMTEASSQIATQGLEQLRSPYQAAPLPLLPIWKAKISADGLLALSGPALFSGHVVDGKFLPREADWHVTSDRVTLSDGKLTPLGRADSRVKVLGELVDPEEIELELMTFSEGRLAPGGFAVVAVPDVRAGHVLVPVIEASVDGEVIESIVSGFNRRVPGFRRLGKPVIVDFLPRSELGKVRRAELMEICREPGWTGDSV